MARRHNREGGNHLDQESNRQMTMEGIDGGLHPAVDGQSLDEDDDDEFSIILYHTTSSHIIQLTDTFTKLYHCILRFGTFDKFKLIKGC